LVYYYYSKWSDPEVFDLLLLSELRERVRVKRGQKAEASLGIIDSRVSAGETTAHSIALTDAKK